MHFHHLTVMMLLEGNCGRCEGGGVEHERIRIVPICHTSNGALLKLHHITGQRSSLVGENVFHL